MTNPKTKRRAAKEGTIYRYTGKGSGSPWRGRKRIAGKVRHFYGKTQADVLRKMKEVEADLARGEFVEPNRITAVSYCREFVAHHRVSDLTRRTMAGHVENWLAPRLGDIALQKLNHREAKRVFRSIERDGRDRRGYAPSPKLVAAIRRTFHTICEEAVDDELLPRNPVLKVTVETPEDPQRIALTPEQADTLQTYAWKAGPRLGALIAFALETGLRWGELAALQWGDVKAGSDGRPEVHVKRSQREAKGSDGESWEVGDGAPKGKAGNRRVPLTPNAERALDRVRGGLGVHPMRRIFPATAGGRLHRSNFQRREWRPLLEDAGLGQITDLTFHSLRHTFASHAANGTRTGKPVPLAVLAKWLGHTKLTTTAKYYLHADDADLQAARDAVSAGT